MAWPRWLNPVAGFWVTFRQMFRPRVTEPYPKV